MPYWEELAQQMGSQAAGGIFGLLLGDINDRRQIRQQEKLQNLQIRGQKEMTDYGFMKQLQMWMDTNYPAQVEQMKLAGLNPGLLYGSKGGGGVTTGSAPGNVTGGQAPSGGGEAMGIMGMTQLTMAQRELIKAQTEKTKAETIKLGGVDTTKTETEIKSLSQGIDNAKAQEELTKVETEIRQIESHIKGSTQNAAIALIMQELRASWDRMEMIKNEHKISDATMNDKIKQVGAELAGIYARNELARAGTKLTAAQIQNISDQIAIAWESLYNAQDQTAIQKKLQEFETSFGGQAAGVLRTIVERFTGARKK